jgi:hypothetical protein
MSKVTLDVITEKEGIIKALFQSRLSKSVIGLKCSALGPGTYFTSVKEIHLAENDEVRVTLQGYDTTGYILDKSHVNLSEIEYVIPLNALFDNPFLRDVKRQMETPGYGVKNKSVAID